MPAHPERVEIPGVLQNLSLRERPLLEKFVNGNRWRFCLAVPVRDQSTAEAERGAHIRKTEGGG